MVYIPYLNVVRFEQFGQFREASNFVLLNRVVHDILYIEPNPVNVPVSEFGHFVNRKFFCNSGFGRWGKSELLFEVFLGRYAPSYIIGKVYLQTVFFDSGGDDMDMLMFGIVMTDYDIGLFTISHMFHISFGEFEKVPVVQVLSSGKVKAGMQIPFFSIVPIAKMVKYPGEKLRIGIGIGIGVLEAEYGAFRFAQYIVEHSLYCLL